MSARDNIRQYIGDEELADALRDQLRESHESIASAAAVVSSMGAELGRKTTVLRDLERWMEVSIKLTPHDRLDWLQAFSQVWLPQIRATLDIKDPA